MYAERLLPHDIDAEEAVIGSLLLDGESLSRIAHLLKPEDFYRERNRFCYESCLALFQRSEGINQITVAHDLALREQLDQVGGMAYLSHLVSIVPSPVHIEYYSGIISLTSTQRRLIDAASNIAEIGYHGEPDAESVLSRAEEVLSRVRATQPARDFVSLRQILDQYMEERDTITGAMVMSAAPIMSGFDDVDELLGGLHRSDLVILAARPSLGKSSLAINVAVNAARNGAVVGIFSLEMGREQIALRMMSSEAGVDAHRLRMGLITEAQEQRINDCIGSLSDLKIYVDDTPFQSIMEMRSKSRRLFMEHGLDLLVVDYLQLIQGRARGGENRVQEMGEISRSAKGMARDLNVPVLAISQLSRAPEARQSHRPQLSDLRESGSIEQDADVVIFIYRDDLYFTEEEWEQRYPDQIYPQNMAEIIVSKHRHGPVGTVKLLFEASLVRFRTAEPEPGAYIC